MALNFPTSPVNNQVYDNYIYNSTLGVWKVNWSLPTQLGTVTVGTWNANPIAIAYGGTGATNVATARANLGLAGLSGIQTFTGTNTFSPTINSAVSLIVKGLSGQTANLQEWQDSAGVVKSYIASSGSIYSPTGSQMGTLYNVFQNSSAANPVVVAKGFTSQTGNLQEWQNSLGTILSRVDANGNIYAPSFTGNLVGSTTSVVATVPGTTSAELVRGNMADNDSFRILVGGTGSNSGYAEIATADDGTEPIFVRQYTGTFATLTRSASLLDGSGNTSFPGVVTAGGFVANAGTTALAPIDLTPGTNLTTPLAGAIEYDGTVITATPNTSLGRAAVATPVFTSGIGTSGIAAATNYALFPAANDTITLPVGTYHVQLNFTLTVATSTTSTALNLNIRGAGGAVGTFTWIGNGAIVSAGAPTQYSQNAVALGTAVTVAPASAVAGRVYTVTGSGILRVTTAGTIIPAYQFPTSPVSGVVTLYADNHVVITPLSSSGSAASAGAWS